MKLNINDKNDINTLRNAKVGDTFYLNGIIYSARDAAHKRIKELVDNNEKLPISLEDKIIYYMGPTPKRPENPIGSCGPTSSYRMDKFLETSLDLGVIATIGKGERDKKVTELIKKHNAPYLITIGGAAAYIAGCIISAEIILFEDLGAEAIKKLELKDFPVIVAIDTTGKSIFEKK